MAVTPVSSGPSCSSAASGGDDSASVLGCGVSCSLGSGVVSGMGSGVGCGAGCWTGCGAGCGAALRSGSCSGSAICSEGISGSTGAIIFSFAGGSLDGVATGELSFLSSSLKGDC